MKTVTHSVDSYNYRKNLAQNLNGYSYVFVDTNILLWCYRVNEHVRNELLTLLETIKKSKRLFFPAWVIQEYNTHLLKMNEDVFNPIRRISKDLEVRINEFEKYFRLTAGNDNQEIKDFIYNIKTYTNTLKVKSISDTDNIRERIESLIQGSVLDSNLTSLIQDACLYGEYRFKNKIPPGYMDKNKEDNNYGDYIIWREIIDKCASEDGADAIIITNDMKEDWVYLPTCISSKKLKRKNEEKKHISEHEKYEYILIPNNGQQENKLYLPHPFLEHEFKKIVGVKYDFYILNIDELTFILSSKDYNIETNQNFSHLAKALSIKVNNTETAIVTEWFLKNRNYYTEAMGIYSPPLYGEIEDLKDFVSNRLHDVDIENVEWYRIMEELFL